MKKKKQQKGHNFYLFVIIIVTVCIFFLWPLFRQGFYVTHDSEPQLARMTAVYKAVVDGHIPARWAGDLNYRYGIPSPNFFFPLNGYLNTLLHLIGFSFQDSYKILMGVSLIASTVFFYLWMTELFGRKIALLTSFFYGLAPYHLLDIYVRGQLGEMLAFVFIPLVFFFIERNKKMPTTRNIILGAVSYALLVLSHNVLGLVFSFIAALYIIVCSWKKWKQIAISASMMFFGLLLSSFFWLPALYENRYINSELFVGGFFRDHFINPSRLFYAPWGFGSDINKLGGLAPYIGVIQGFLLLSSTFVFITSQKKRSMVFWFFITVFSIFMTLPLSSFLWESVNFIEQFQFPWRFLAIVSLSGSVLIGHVLSVLRPYALPVFLTFCAVLLSFPLVKVHSFTDKPDQFYLRYSGTGAYHGESTTIWTAGDASLFPKAPIEIIDGKGGVANYYRKTQEHQFSVQADSPVKIVDNTTYFPGWHVYVDGVETPIEFQDANHRGLITFNVLQGKHAVSVIFEETKIRLLADTLSISVFAGMMLLLIFRNRINRVLS